VKRLIGIVIAVIAILVMSVPAMALPITTSVTVGNGGLDQPVVLAMAIVPDNNSATTALGDVEVDPEAALPVSGDFLAANMLNTPGSDGWKMVKFYVIVYHPTAFEHFINKISVDVFYPTQDRKFELDATRDGTSHNWIAGQSYNTPEYYPVVSLADTPELAVVPGWTARELLYTTNVKDLVDVGADGSLAGDPNVIEFLTQYGSRVKYNLSDTYATIGEIENLLNAEQAIVVELTGFIWFHQPACTYGWQAKASLSGTDSEVLADSFKFNKLVGLYLDFGTVVYGPTTPNAQQADLAPADRWLSTPGATTIWDNGNTNAQVYVTSTKMVKGWNGVGAFPADYNEPTKTITSFDAALYYANLSGGSIQVGHINYNADESAKLIVKGSPYNPIETGQDGAVLLQACRPAKIEFSVRTGDIWQGLYGGRITISVAEYVDGSQTEVNN
jgi:hypothetical protein